jgi:hypothetical protein
VHLLRLGPLGKVATAIAANVQNAYTSSLSRHKLPAAISIIAGPTCDIPATASVQSPASHHRQHNDSPGRRLKPQHVPSPTLRRDDVRVRLSET